MSKLFVVASGDPLDIRLTGNRYSCVAVDAVEAQEKYLRKHPLCPKVMAQAKEVDEATANKYPRIE